MTMLLTHRPERAVVSARTICTCDATQRAAAIFMITSHLRPTSDRDFGHEISLQERDFVAEHRVLVVRWCDEP
jgi:hypothetical protein